MTTIDLQRIFHPTDLSSLSVNSFGHALKLSVAARSMLTIYHTEPHRHAASWQSFPHVREVLEMWGLIPPHSGREAVAELGLGIEKVSAAHRNATTSVLKFLERHPHDLIVLTTYQHGGLDRFLKGSVAEPIARRSGESTLFIPATAAGFISFQTGQVSLRQILIPIELTPHPQLAIEAAALIATLLGVNHAVFHLLHTSSHATRRIEVPAQIAASCNMVVREGNVVERTLEVARELAVDLIVTASSSHDTLLDALRGTAIERLIRSTSCPVLTIPTEQLMNSSLQEILIYQTD
jgi:nucleotide-binding universal stress UspA family protein